MKYQRKIKILRLYDVECQKCGVRRSKLGTPENGMMENKDQLYAAAGKEGWALHGKKTLCPACAAKSGIVTRKFCELDPETRRSIPKGKKYTAGGAVNLLCLGDSKDGVLNPKCAACEFKYTAPSSAAAPSALTGLESAEVAGFTDLEGDVTDAQL